MEGVETKSYQQTDSATELLSNTDESNIDSSPNTLIGSLKESYINNPLYLVRDGCYLVSGCAAIAAIHLVGTCWDFQTKGNSDNCSPGYFAGGVAFFFKFLGDEAGSSAVQIDLHRIQHKLKAG